MTRKEVVNKLIINARDKDFDNLTDAYTEYTFGNVSKKRLSYYLKKVGISLEEYEEWACG